VEIPALVSRFLMQAGDSLASFAAASRSLLLSGYRPVRPTKFLVRLAIVARRLHGLAIGGNEEALKPKVYAYLSSVCSSFRDIPEIAREDHVPLDARAPDADGLDNSIDRAVQLDLDVPDVLEVEPSVVLQAAAVRGKLDGPEPLFRFESGVAGFAPLESVPGLHAPEERLECFVQPTKCRLSGREVQSREARKRPAGLFEPARLFAVVYGAFFGFVHVSPLPKSKVVQAAVRLKHRVQCLRLRAVRIEPVFERATHLALPNLLSIDVARDGRIGDMARIPDAVAAAPEHGHPGSQVLVTLAKSAGGVALELSRQLGRRILRYGLHEQLNVVGLNREVLDFNADVLGFLAKQVVEVFGNRPDRYGKVVLRAPDEAEVQVGDDTGCSPMLHTGTIRDCYTEYNPSNRGRGDARAFPRQLKQPVLCS
jgi:hypothetical protein